MHDCVLTVMWETTPTLHMCGCVAMVIVRGLDYQWLCGQSHATNTTHTCSVVPRPCHYSQHRRLLWINETKINCCWEELLNFLLRILDSAPKNKKVLLFLFFLSLLDIKFLCNCLLGRSWGQVFAVTH